MREILLTGKRSLLKTLFAMSFLLAASTAFAQQRNVTGSVKDEVTGEALPGVNVVVKGSSTGTITDAEGAFSLQIQSEDDVLVFSFIGYAKAEVPVAGKATIDVALKTDVTSLEEVVVVGYGEQKKSVVTGAISGVKASELESMPLNRIEQALQGRTSGLTIAAGSGQPGSSATIRVRGITTINNNDPLFVVDGVVVDNGGIGYLNQADIESIEVLKDASSQAIYGARAAAGVILVTTKKGASGKMQINYNGYYGTSAPAHKLDLLNAAEYATLRNEARIAAGMTPLYVDPSSLGKGTDWQKQIFNNDARRQNHELSISGGGDKSTYYASFGYLDQEGIVATEISNYRRTNLRLNSNHKIREWMTFGQTLGYAYTKSTGLGNTNSVFGGPLSSAINLDPTTPVVVTDPAIAAGYNQAGMLRDSNGNPYGISTVVGQELTNPVAYTQTRLGNYGWANDFVGNAFLEVEPIKGLKIKSTLGGKLAFWGGESFTPIFFLNSSQRNTTATMDRSMNKVFNWNVENTIMYTRAFDKHNVSVLLGQGAYSDSFTNYVGANFSNVDFEHFYDATFNKPPTPANRFASASDGTPHKVSSLFARVNYNYDEKYLFTGIIRRDGSSRFGSNNKYGVFPSFSAGWVASRESFWPENKVVDFLKVRGGYGVVGNDNIGDFMYLPLVGPGRNYTITTSPEMSLGSSPNAPANPDLKWEETRQLNIGFEANLFNNISLTFDLFKKETIGMLTNPRIPGYVGAIADPAANLGDMENKGFEVELGYKTNIGDLNLGFNGNFSYIQNKLTYIGNGIEFFERDNATVHTMNGAVTRSQVGHAYNAFYGYVIEGVFQNDAQIAAHTNSEGTVIQPDAKPGDFIWADLDDDGDIDANDRKFIGDPTPNITYGLTLNANYKGFDVVIFGQGVAGNQIFQGLRRLDINDANYQNAALGRWTGEGSTNSYPRLTDLDENKNFNNPSSFYLEDGDYFRLKTVQLGYSLPKALISKAGFSRVRVYIMAENLVTFTKYTGYDPEIGGGVMSIDQGIYPQARSFMGGLNLTF